MNRLDKKQKEERKEKIYKIYKTLETVGLMGGLILASCEPVELWGFVINFAGLGIAFPSIKVATER